MSHIFSPEFMRLLSHDLRSQARSVNSLSGILLEDSAEVLGPESLAFLSNIQRISTQMTKLLEDVSELARIEQRTPNVETVSLRKVIQSVLMQMDIQLPPHVSIDGDPTWLGDQKLLALVIREVLSNSLEYVKPGEFAEITISADADQIDIQDKGIGFNSDLACKLGDPFYRLHPASRYPGSGLGLFKVRQIVERLGLGFSIEGKPECGATVTIKLR